MTDSNADPTTTPAEGDDAEALGRAIELSIEVAGTPEAVWDAIATGPGISSWYVPHEVEEADGGAATARFGPGPEMEVPGRVAAWDPPKRILFDGGEGVEGLAFEWLVEARSGDTCVVRLVNSGFGSGADWDGQYDAMTEGWIMFLSNLKAHLDHFPGQAGRPTIPTATWPGPREDAWARLTGALGLPSTPGIGQRVEVTADDAPPLAGTVLDATPHRLTLLLDQPCPGTALLAAEGYGGEIHASVWTYLYGPEADATATTTEPAWESWLTTHA